MRHLFITTDYPPIGGGMARRYAELCRRMRPDKVTVSSVAAPETEWIDANEQYEIVREPFLFGKAKLLSSRLRWAAHAASLAADSDVIHCGNIRPAGDPTWWGSQRQHIPYLLYVNGGDILIELRKIRSSRVKHFTAKRIFGDAAAIVSNSAWTTQLAKDLAAGLGITSPPIHTIPLGADPAWFQPSRDSRRLRERFRFGDRPLLLTVARLVPHKGQDQVIHALARLHQNIPELRYLIVGRGPDKIRLQELALLLGVEEMVAFADSLNEYELADAYATADVYVGLSRINAGIFAEGFGISFVEAMASGTAVIAGDSGGVRSAVEDKITGLLVPPEDTAAAAAAIETLILNPERRAELSAAGRLAVVSHLNWDRVARDTLELAKQVACK